MPVPLFISNMQKLQDPFSFQCADEDVPFIDRTLHLLMAAIPDKTIDDARYEDMPVFISSKKNWCMKAASFVLERKGKRFERWRKKFLDFAFDPVAIMIWARCYRRHVAFFFNYYFWCTHKKDDVSKCDVVLAFRGGTSFEATRIMTTEEASQAEQGIARVQAYYDELSLKENVQNMHRKRAKEYRRKVDKIVSSEDESPSDSDGRTSEDDLDLEEAMESADTGDNSKSLDQSDKALDMRKKQSSENNMQKKDSAVNTSMIDDNNMQNIPTPDNDNTTPPGSDQEQEVKPTASGIQHAAEDSDGNDIQNSDDADSNPDSQSDSGSSASEGDNNMQKTPTKQRLRKPKAARVLYKTYHCLAPGCNITKQSKVAVLKHMKENHKDYRFKCNKCPQTFASWIGHYKHRKRHLGKPYICDDCGKGFQFGGELDEHVRGHTREELFSCDSCDKAYPSKRALQLHKKSHTDSREYYCDFQDKKGKVCGQVCVSAEHLKQHHRGMHGEGWVCYCGKRYQWPGTMYNHRKECTAKHSKCST